MRRCTSYGSARQSVRVAALLCVAALTSLSCAAVQSADWIWSPLHAGGEVPASDCFFRGHFAGGDPVAAKLTIAADDQYEVYLNGRRIVQGEGWRDPKSYNIQPLIHKGNNILAVKVSNTEGASAGLAATIEVTQRGGQIIEYATDDTWKTSLRPLALWHLPRYSDSRWDTAQAFGPQGTTAPWKVAETSTERNSANNSTASNTAPNTTNNTSSNNAPSNNTATDNTAANNTPTNNTPAPTSEVTSAGEAPAPTETAQPARRQLPDNQPQFRTQADFEVQVLAGHADVGSLIAAEFNEFHELILAKENGPLLIMVDSNKDGLPETPRVYCDQVKNVQGILPINGDVYVTGEGPQGIALYRLADKDRDGKLEVAAALMKFTHVNDAEEKVGEHGPHGLALGPDGHIYVAVGNHATIDGEFDPASPFQTIYEGDIVPRFEDPAGHARDIPAPGGTVVRIPLAGGKPQRIAGGLRNAYDLAFDQWGNLFTYDSDMEADIGASWYQPTRVQHIIPGGEYGWRSGWAKWPTYWHDALPPTVTTGRGSPTGMVVYDHFMFPEKYQHDLMVADWTGGRILHIDIDPDGATVAGKFDVLMQGKPLTLTDITVGPDGWLYFVTGGRDTAGAVYRLVYKGETPNPATRIGKGTAAAIRYPQFQSAWTRQEIAKIKRDDGERWKTILPAIARTEKNSARFRCRALDLMHLYGPTLSAELLIKLANDQKVQVRTKAVEVMGWRPKEAYHEQLIKSLTDENATVRRCACEAIVRCEAQPTLEQLQPLLTSKDRYEALAARRVLESLPTDSWQAAVLSTDDHRLFIQGGTALLLAHGDKIRAKLIATRFGELLEGYITDADFNDMLRLSQIAVEKGKLTADDIPELTHALTEEFPSSNVKMNRELLRLLVGLKVNTIGDRYIAYLESGLQPEEHLQVAVHLSLIEGGWTSQQRLAILKNLEQSRSRDGGSSVGGYVQNVTRMFARQLSEEEQRLVLEQAASLPTAAVAVLYLLPEEPQPATLDALRQAYGQLDGKKDQASETLKIGIIAILGESGDETSMDFLRRQYPDDPNKQAFLAMSLAQQPDGPNWELLLDSLRVVEGISANMVLKSLATVERAPDKPEPYRQAIIRGLELGEESTAANELLESWTGKQQPGDTTAAKLAGWQTWFQLRWPEEPEATLPKTAKESKWIYDELVAHISSDENIAAGSAHRGSQIFTSAQCAACHRNGDVGDSIGPDLTNLTQRFRRKEILESIIYPSHVISDQYRSKTVITDKGRQYTGIVAAGAPGEVVILQQDGKKVPLERDSIEEILPSRKSAMPEGLIDNLTLQEVTDLFTYLSQPPKTSTATRQD